MNGVGTLRKFYRHIPEKFLTKKDIGSSEFAFDDKKMMVCYTPKKNRNVILLSTAHHTTKIDETTNKPEVVLFYNQTKSGTDKFDQLCKTYTVARKTRRWPLRIFYAMLDQSAVNAFILYTLKSESLLYRRMFLKNLGFELAENHMIERAQTPQLRSGIKKTIKEILDESVPDQSSGPYPTTVARTRCGLCDRSEDKKTISACQQCGRPICNMHRVFCCVECCVLSQKDEIED